MDPDVPDPNVKKNVRFSSNPIIHKYSAVSNKCAVWNNRVGYYIGLFGYNIKNYFLFNKFF